MKYILKYLASVFIASTLLCACNGNEEQVPQAVKTSFENEYPNASNVEWEQAGDQYIVDFRADDAQGNIIEKIGDLEDEALPPTSREVN